MPKPKQKLPLLVIIISILLILLALQILSLVSVSLYFYFFSSYPKPENVPWLADIIKFSAISVFIIITAILLLKRKNYARILSIIILFILSIWNIKAEISVFNNYSPLRLIPWVLFLLSALYLLFSRKVKKVFS